MKPFRLFLSHCDDAKTRLYVGCLYELLEQAFKADIAKGSFKISYDGDEGVVELGRELHPALVEEVQNSDVVLGCFFKRWPQADHFQKEIKAAFEKPVFLIPILFLGPNEKAYHFRLGDLDPRLEHDQGGQSVHSRLEISYGDASDASTVTQLIRDQIGSTLGGMLIANIRNRMIDRARRDLTMYERADELLDDLSEHPSTFINMFLYDGGTTIRRLGENRKMLEYLQHSPRRQVKFLYVDTNFKAFVRETKEFQQTPELEKIDERLYAPLYEALVRKSWMLHNDSPEGHMYDVAQSISALRTLAKDNGFELEIKKTCLIPFYRMVITRLHAYYTHVLPTFPAVRWGDGAKEFYSLRLSTSSPAGMSLSKHFDRLWDNAAPHVD